MAQAKTAGHPESAQHLPAPHKHVTAPGGKNPGSKPTEANNGAGHIHVAPQSVPKSGANVGSMPGPNGNKDCKGNC
jgi:hypothetical protein